MIEKPEKVFPCDCGYEGIVVSEHFDGYEGETVVVTRDGDLEDNWNHYCVHLGFWGMGPYNNGSLSWRRRLSLAWQILRTGQPWLDMVMLTPTVAKKLANHILYRVEQIEYKLSMKPDELKIRKTSPQTNARNQDDSSISSF